MYSNINLSIQLLKYFNCDEFLFEMQMEIFLKLNILILE